MLTHARGSADKETARRPGQSHHLFIAYFGSGTFQSAHTAHPVSTVALVPSALLSRITCMTCIAHASCSIAFVISPIPSFIFFFISLHHTRYLDSLVSVLLAISLSIAVSLRCAFSRSLCVCACALACCRLASARRPDFRWCGVCVVFLSVVVPAFLCMCVLVVTACASFSFFPSSVRLRSRALPSPLLFLVSQRVVSSGAGFTLHSAYSVVLAVSRLHLFTPASCLS